MDIRFSYTLVGIFMVILIILFFLVFLWLATPKEANTELYKIIFNESVSGLELNSTVKFNGVQVGYVQKIYLDNKDLSKVNVIVAISKKIKIGPRTIAILNTQGLTGITHISLSLNMITSILALVKDKDGLFIIPSSPSLFFRLDKAIQISLEELKSISKSFDNILSKNNIKEFDQILKNIETITETFAGKSADIGSIINNSNNFISKLDKASKQLPEVLQHLQDASKKISDLFYKLDQKTARELNSALSTIDKTVNNWNVQLLPKLNQSFNNLHKILLNMQTVSGELVENPSILIRGKIPEPLGPGER